MIDKLSARVIYISKTDMGKTLKLSEKQGYKITTMCCVHGLC